MTMRSIYVVDDDQAVRSALQSLLSTRPDLMVFGYRSGDDFLAQIDTLVPGCILLDYDMPGSNGLDVLRAIVGLPRKFGAIILTGQGATSIAVQAWNSARSISWKSRATRQNCLRSSKPPSPPSNWITRRLRDVNKPAPRLRA